MKRAAARGAESVGNAAFRAASECARDLRGLRDGRDKAGACRVQVLVSRTSFNVPRRTSNGFDFNRANLLLAVTEKRGGLNISMCDAYVNVIGGLYLDEPAADLALVLAVASSHRDTPIDPKTLAIGEVGLTGEVRAVTSMQQRLTEAARLGFTRCIVPRHSTKQLCPMGWSSSA